MNYEYFNDLKLIDKIEYFILNSKPDERSLLKDSIYIEKSHIHQIVIYKNSKYEKTYKLKVGIWLVIYKEIFLKEYRKEKLKKLKDIL